MSEEIFTAQLKKKKQLIDHAWTTFQSIRRVKYGAQP